jgi:hypothetical protein
MDWSRQSGKEPVSKLGSGRHSMGGQDDRNKLDAVPEASASPRMAGKFKGASTSSNLGRQASTRASVESLPKFTATSSGRYVQIGLGPPRPWRKAQSAWVNGSHAPAAPRPSLDAAGRHARAAPSPGPRLP